MARKQGLAEQLNTLETLIAAAGAGLSIEQIDEAAETEVLSLHEGNFARYGVRPSEFKAWRDGWKQPR